MILRRRIKGKEEKKKNGGANKVEIEREKEEESYKQIEKKEGKEIEIIMSKVFKEKQM